jgi:hypothetical protein
MFEVFYPLKIGSTQDRHNWIAAMMLDTRLGDRDKTILTRLALHLNLKTGRCDPTVDLLALETSIPGKEETARRMVRRSVAQAERVGWIERTGRHSGSRLNRSNAYRLTIPGDVRPDKFDRSSGQIEEGVRTPESGRIGKENREREYSVSSIQPLARFKGPSEEGRAASNYSPADTQLVRETLAWAAETRALLLTIGSLTGYFRVMGCGITAPMIGAMCRDGLFAREGDNISLMSR